MKGYKNAQITQVEDDLKRCRELSMAILTKERKVSEIKEAYSHIRGNQEIDNSLVSDWVKPIEEQKQELAKNRFILF